MRDGAKYKLRALRTWKTVSLCDIKTNKKPTEAAIKTKEKSRHVRARKQDSCCSFLAPSPAPALQIADAGPILSSFSSSFSSSSSQDGSAASIFVQ